MPIILWLLGVPLSLVLLLMLFGVFFFFFFAPHRGALPAC